MRPIRIFFEISHFVCLLGAFIYSTGLLAALLVVTSNTQTIGSEIEIDVPNFWRTAVFASTSVLMVVSVGFMRSWTLVKKPPRYERPFWVGVLLVGFSLLGFLVVLEASWVVKIIYACLLIGGAKFLADAATRHHKQQ